ncbi:MAG: patatin-like protein [Nakamurella sp.]
MALLTQTSVRNASGRGESVAKTAGRPETTELRLAVVCDGGVSLAIYEHGVIKELQNLVVASRVWDAVAQYPTGSPEIASARAGLTGTQPHYFDALADRVADPVSVVIDVISGTSAGGINGVFLAKGLAKCCSQDSLTSLWLDKGDLGKLAHRHLPGLVGALIETVLSLPRHTFSRGWSPLHGDDMSQWLLQALNAMDTSPLQGLPPGQESLLPTGHDLDLFVTTTDLSGLPLSFPSPDGSAGEHDRTHRKLFHYAAANTSAPAAGVRFGPQDNYGLAFAARCTSGFPGAFAPNRLDHFLSIVEPDRHLADQAAPAVINDQMREYVLSGKNPSVVDFSDGGLLDNSPLDHVIEAIAAKSAQNRVDRRILHIQPDPATWAAPNPSEPAANPHLPRYFDGVRAALATRTYQSNVQQMLDIRELNQIIGEVGQITVNMQYRVSNYLDSCAQAAGAPTLDQARTWSDQVHSHVTDAVGAWNIDTYRRLKVSAIGKMISEDLNNAFEFPLSTQHGSFVCAVISQWMDGDGFWVGRVDGELSDFLNATDMPYRERRVRFLLQAVNDLYQMTGNDAPPASAINSLKQAAWTELNHILAFRSQTAATVASTAADFLRSLTTQDCLNPAAFAAAHSDGLGALVAAYHDALTLYQADSAQALWPVFTGQTKDWTETTRRALLYRWVGFPLWDALIYPLIALSRLPQLTPIQTQRISPLDNTLLQPTNADGTPVAKLLGTRVAHFGGFLDRKWRENDYLWGRLDAAVILLGILGKTAWTDQPIPGAITAVLDSEATRLTTAQSTIASLRASVTTSVTNAHRAPPGNHEVLSAT